MMIRHGTAGRVGGRRATRNATCHSLSGNSSFRNAVPIEKEKNTRLFLDTADATKWELFSGTGLFYGFTTNPTILEACGVLCNVKSLTGLAATAFSLGAKELHLQAWGDSVQKMSSVAFDLAGINPQSIVVKLPCTFEGIQTASLLKDSGIRLNITGIYSPSQVMLADTIGAEYAAPYLGRMNDLYGSDKGTKQVLEMQEILKNTNSSTRLMVASLRDTSIVAMLASKGCNTFTISPAIATKFFNVNPTIDAVAEFEAAARRNGGYAN